jgi:hypothetical protein
MRIVPIAAAAALALGLAGCGGGTGGAGTGSALGDLLIPGAVLATPPTTPLEEALRNENRYGCPTASIVPGGAAIRVGGQQGSDGVRAQISINDIARECSQVRNGVMTVRVGAEGRVLAGPAGGSGGGQFATLRIEVRQNDRVLATRSARVGANIPAGAGGADWVHVEQGISIPQSALDQGGDIDIFVGLGGAAPERAARRRRG